MDRAKNNRLDSGMIPELSVIIVHYDALESLRGCLGSVLRDARGRSWEVIVVDNASATRPAEVLAHEFPGVAWVQNEKNFGFARACQEALKQAKAPYLLLLNPDTVVKGDALQEMLGFLKTRADVAAVGPRILNPNGSPQKLSFHFPGLLRYLGETLFLERLFPFDQDPAFAREVDWVTGAALMVSRTALGQEVLFDDRFFMYFEDVDLCRRLREKGFRIFYLPRAEVVHWEGERSWFYSERYFSARKIEEYHRSLLVYLDRHERRVKVLFFRPLIAFRSLLRLLLWSVILVFSSPGFRVRCAERVRGYRAALRISFSRVRGSEAMSMGRGT